MALLKRFLLAYRLTIRYYQAMVRVLLTTLLLLCILMLGGCHRSLFPDDNKNLTQFDAYDTMRHGALITEKPDEYGLPEPAIRTRLSRHRR